jgi:tetratricopeptide (TPR) repeat protein
MFTISIDPQIDLFKQKEYADSLFFNENYFDAITEYKRLIFFDEEKLFNYYSFFQIALCYKHSGKFEDSYNYLSLALAEAQTNEEIYQSKINLCRLNIIENKIKNAHRILDDLEKDTSFNHLALQTKYWRAWIYFFERNFEKSTEIFELLGFSELAEISKNNSNEFFSVDKAKFLSYIIPGAGQIYTGHYLSGIGSLAWNILSSYLTLNAFWQERIFDGILISNLLWLRFYRGNISNAENFAIIKNDQLFYQSLYKILENFPDLIP